MEQRGPRSPSAGCARSAIAGLDARGRAAPRAARRCSSSTCPPPAAGAGRHRPALRPPRQAARDDRLARGPRPVDAGARGRQALRPRRRRRRLRGLRVARRDQRAAGAGRAARALRRCSSRPARRAAATTCPRTSSTSRRASASVASSSCLDSGCGDYDQLWSTTSLRGLVVGTLDVEVLTEGVHSGDASGVVPSSLPHRAPAARPRSRTSATGAIAAARCSTRTIPRRARRRRRAAAAEVLGDDDRAASSRGPGATRPMVDDRAELILNRTWRPALAITGADGLPPIGNAGNVLRP